MRREQLRRAAAEAARAARARGEPRSERDELLTGRCAPSRRAIELAQQSRKNGKDPDEPSRYNPDEEVEMSRLVWYFAAALAAAAVVVACDDDGGKVECCEGADGSFTVLLGDFSDKCGFDSSTAPNTSIRSVPPGEEPDTVGICGTVCCVGAGGERSTTEDIDACIEGGGTARPEADCDGGGGSCKCSDAGVTFTVVSGCEDTDDATEPSFCRSHIEFNLIEDPDTFALESGSTMSFPGCEVRITCP